VVGKKNRLERKKRLQRLDCGGENGTPGKKKERGREIQGNLGLKIGEHRGAEVEKGNDRNANHFQGGSQKTEKGGRFIRKKKENYKRGGGAVGSGGKKEDSDLVVGRREYFKKIQGV